jgi:hypothetical protein
VKFFVRASILLSMLLLSGCSDAWCWPFDCSSSASSSGVVDDSPAVVDNQVGGSYGTTSSKLFKLEFQQTSLPCASCGWLFDSLQLVVKHSQGKFVKNGKGFLVKKGGNRNGHFSADLSSIPSAATIDSATLYMRFNTHEGIAREDNSSRVVVFGWVDDKKTLVKNLTTQKDVKGKGYSKANPNMPVDFTVYAKRVH